jgi:HlyD family secretion protein
MKKRIIIILSIVLAVVLILLIFKDKGRKELKVAAEVSAKRAIVQTVTATGKVQPEIELAISPDVSGEITDIYVVEGDTVREGQILLKIKPDLYLSSVDRANAGVNTAMSAKKIDEVLLKQAQSRLTEATSSYNRTKELYAKKVISTAEFEKAESAYQLALADVQSAKQKISTSDYSIDNAQANLREAQQNLSRTIIYAPTDGVVSKVNNKRGERVVGTAQMQGTEIMRISNFVNVEVRVDVNENDILKINKGDSAIIEVDAYGERKFKGIVTQIAKASNKAASAMSTDQVTTFEVKIRLLKSSYADLMVGNSIPFLPGLSANVDIQTNRGDGLITVPIGSVTTRASKNTDSKDEKDKKDELVFIVKNGVAVSKKVVTGIQDNMYIEIKSGLALNEMVITDPYDILSTTLDSGRKVKIVDKSKLFEIKSED